MQVSASKTQLAASVTQFFCRVDKALGKDPRALRRKHLCLALWFGLLGLVWLGDDPTEVKKKVKYLEKLPNYCVNVLSMCLFMFLTTNISWFHPSKALLVGGDRL